MKKFILLFLVLCMGLHSQPKKEKPIVWNNMIVTIQKSDRKIQSISFKDKKSKKVIKEFTDGYNYLSHGFYKNQKKNYFYVYSHSGGESGGSLLFDIYYPESDGVGVYSEEYSGYGSIDITDIDKDKVQEVQSLNSLFYGNAFPSGKKNCSISILGLYATGFGTLQFPVFQEFDIESNKLINKTFDKKYHNFLKPSIQKAEKFLEEKKNSELGNENLDLAGVLQYYYYMSRLDKEQEALTKIQQSNIIVSKCSEKGITVYQLIKENRNKILWGD